LNHQVASDTLNWRGLPRIPAESPIRELSASAPGWQRKGNGGAGDRLMVLLLDTDDRCARGALADIINGAFHDHGVEFHGERSRV
jgi:hypothetical protein